MMAETLFRDTPLPTMDSYLKIRIQTIGVVPFIALAKWSLYKVPNKVQNSGEIQD
jgi:hypothetical protein